MVLLLLAGMALPNFGQAYFTTDQQAVRLHDGNLLFTISYQFGFGKRHVYMPILAESNLSNNTTPNTMSFILTADGEPIEVENISAIALTSDEDATIIDRQYHLDPYRSALFTLVALVKLSGAEQARLSGAELGLKVTNFPFTMVTEEDEVIKARLGQTELDKYHTPTLTI